MLLLSVDLVLELLVVTNLDVRMDQVLVDQVSIQDWHSIYHYFLVTNLYTSFILVMYILQLLLASNLVLDFRVAELQVSIDVFHTFKCTSLHLLTLCLGLTT